MRPPVIPATLRVCATCHADQPMAGRQDCCECVLARRFAAWAWADGELPPGMQFVGDGASKTFKPAPPQAAELPSGWPSAPPRITEVPQAALDARLSSLQERTRELHEMERQYFREQAARRSAAWVWLWVLWAFALGWCYGRFG